MSRLIRGLALAVFALALLVPQVASARLYAPLATTLVCSTESASYFCVAYPSGGTGSYTYEWRWYGPGYPYVAGNTARISRTGCYNNTNYTLLVIVRDSAGASTTASTYLAC